MKAVICPVCKGTGRYYGPPPDGSTLAVGNWRACHGCNGKGWIEVHEEPRGLDITYIPTVWEDFPNIPYSGTWHEEEPCLVYG